jgi:hypothetical protein
MKRLLVAALAVAGVLGSIPFPAEAGVGHGAPRSREARFDARAAVRRVDRLLARQQALGQPAQIEVTSPYLPDIQGDRGVDRQIRRLGELMRRGGQD